MLSWYNWLIVIPPFSAILYMALHMRKSIRSVPDFLAGGGICGCCPLSAGSMEAGLSAMTLIVCVEVHCRSGFSCGFRTGFITQVSRVPALTGFVTETEVLRSMGQSLGMRCIRSFRLFCAVLRNLAQLSMGAMYNIPRNIARSSRRNGTAVVFLN